MTGKHAVRAFTTARQGSSRRRRSPTSTCARPADQHRLDGQRVDGAGARGHHGPRGHAAGHRLHHPVRLGLRGPGEALRRGALHLGRLREGQRRRADLAHRRAAPRPLRLDARRDAQVGHRLAWSSPSRSTSTRPHTPTPTRCRTCRRTSPSATSAPRAWAATAASRSSRASSRRRAPTRSSGTPTAWSPAATTGSAGWTTATTGPWWPIGPAQQVAIDSDPLDSVTVVPAGTPLDIVFTGARMMCWRTIHFTTAGDFTKTRGYPDPLTWHTGGLAPGTYEWQCWMGPQCHHGTVVVQ